MIYNLPTFIRERNAVIESRDPGRIRAWAAHYGFKHLIAMSEAELLFHLAVMQPAIWEPPNWQVGRSTSFADARKRTRAKWGST